MKNTRKQSELKIILVIEEFMQKVNDVSMSDICEADLLGEVYNYLKSNVAYYHETW